MKTEFILVANVMHCFIDLKISSNPIAAGPLSMMKYPVLLSASRMLTGEEQKLFVPVVADTLVMCFLEKVIRKRIPDTA